MNCNNIDKRQHIGSTIDNTFEFKAENVQGKRLRPIPDLIRLPLAEIQPVPNVPVGDRRDVQPPAVSSGTGVAELFSRGVPECCGAGCGGDSKCRINGIVSSIRKLPLRQRIIREIIVVRSEQDVRDTLGILSRKISGIAGRASSSFIAIAGHPAPNWDHIHVVHDCTYSGSYCKCSWLQEYRRGRTYTGPLPYIGGKAKGDLRPIYAREVQAPESGYLANLLR